MMNKDILEGKWQENKGKIKEKWGKLTDNDLTQINGKREVFLGKLQTLYGYAKEKAENELANFEKSCGCKGENKDSQEWQQQNERHAKR